MDVERYQRAAASPALYLCLLGLALGVAGCPPTTVPPSAPPLPPELDFPAAYRVQAAGQVQVDTIELPGTATMDYLVYPSGRVVVTHLDVRVPDLDIVVYFLWWETDRERLRCNRMHLTEPVVASLVGDRIDFAVGSAAMRGVSFFERSPSGDCSGRHRRLEVSNDGVFSVLHDPDMPKWEMRAAFTATFDGNSVPLDFRLDGRFLNRPPMASMGVAEAGTTSWELIGEGCPVAQEESKIPPNRPEGLVLDLRSFSYDNDSRESETRFQVKFPRGDISTEQWAKSSGGKYEYLGEGRLLGPVLFEAGKAHSLMLTVTDRTGAKARQICQFEVSPS